MATPIVNDAGEGLLADYQKLRYSLANGFSGEAQVAPAGVWLMRREVWQRHGFHDYAGRLHEDVHFSRTLRAAGLSLRILPGPPARQIRRLSRTTMARRGWTWQGPEFLEAAKANPIDPANALLVAVGRRMERHRAANPAFLYYDCLYLAHALADILGQAGYVADAAALPAVLAGVLPEPRAGAYLLADLARLGHGNAPDGPAGPASPLAAALGQGLASLLPPDAPAALAGALPEPLAGAYLLADLARLGHETASFAGAGQAAPLVAALAQGLASLLPPDAPAALAAAVPELAAEDVREDWDFSFYDALPSAAK